MSEALRGPLLLAGCGKMGSALLGGWLEAGLPASDAWIVEPNPGGALPNGVKAVATPDELPPDLQPRLLLLAVKPQMMDGVAPAYRRFVANGATVLSIAAGKTVSYFEDCYGADASVIRAMPNTPAAVGRGASVLFANERASDPERQLAEQLLRAVGEVHWVRDEELLHVVTAMSGGGPAYVFLLIEALAAAAVKLGLPDDLAIQLARTTVSGSGELARLSPEPAAQLRKNVTSPNGTTQAALGVLMAGDGLQPLVDRAIAAAAQRSRELA